MRRLGEILLERGYASVGELHTALEASHRHKGRLGSQLLRLGFVTEKQLLEALAEQTGCPPLPREVLRQTPAEIRRLIPPADLQRLQVVPFALHHGRIQVAMTNPRDRATIDEIQSITGMVAEVYVATETTISEAIRAVGAEVSRKVDQDSPVQEELLLKGDATWERLWSGKMPSAGDLLQVSREWLKFSDRLVRYATYPALSPVLDPNSVQGPGYLDEEQFQRVLVEAESRDDIGEALLGYAARFLSRICLFSVFKHQVHGWLVHGMGPVIEDVESFSISLEVPSIFSVLYKTGTHLQAPMPPGERNRSILQCLGEPLAEHIVLIPFLLKGRIVGFLLGDIPGQSTVTVPVDELKTASAAAGLALEMMLLKRKIFKSLRSSGRKKET